MWNSFMYENLKTTVERAWNDRELLRDEAVKSAIRETVDLLDRGELRTAEPLGDSRWQVNEWVKKAVILYFPICGMRVTEAGPMEFYDKLDLKTGYEKLGVIVEDGCFVGSRCIVVEGAHVCREAVLGAGTVITGSTRIIDVSGPEPKEYKGYVPSRSVVIPGSRTKRFPAGEYQVPCALIIGQRKASTDTKTSLNDALREFDVPV